MAVAKLTMGVAKPTMAVAKLTMGVAKILALFPDHNWQFSAIYGSSFLTAGYALDYVIKGLIPVLRVTAARSSRAAV